MSEVRVVVCDPEPIARSGLRMLLEQQFALQVVAEVEPQHLASTVTRMRPGVIVLEFGHPREHTFASIRQLTCAGQSRDLAVLVLTATRDTVLAFSALRAGARGYLHKGCELRDLVAAIHAVAQGQAAIAPEITGQLLRWVGPYLPGSRDGSADLEHRLTPREREILHLVALGESNDAIARKLRVSKATVRSHVHHILMKIGVGDRTQAVAYAYRVGFVSPFS
jgi:DNA-binding NarL/FixJ family response regulator